jgi:hypothetical protein
VNRTMRHTFVSLLFRPGPLSGEGGGAGAPPRPGVHLEGLPASVRGEGSRGTVRLGPSPRCVPQPSHLDGRGDAGGTSVRFESLRIGRGRAAPVVTCPFASWALLGSNQRPLPCKIGPPRPTTCDDGSFVLVRAGFHYRALPDVCPPCRFQCGLDVAWLSSGRVGLPAQQAPPSAGSEARRQGAACRR